MDIKNIITNTIASKISAATFPAIGIKKKVS